LYQHEDYERAKDDSDSDENREDDKEDNHDHQTSVYKFQGLWRSDQAEKYIETSICASSITTIAITVASSAASEAHTRCARASGT
jgi:hypothetical protein